MVDGATAGIQTAASAPWVAAPSGAVGMYEAMRRPDQVRPVVDATRSPVNVEMHEDDELRMQRAVKTKALTASRARSRLSESSQDLCYWSAAGRASS